MIQALPCFGSSISSPPDIRIFQVRLLFPLFQVLPTSMEYTSKLFRADLDIESQLPQKVPESQADPFPNEQFDTVLCYMR